MISGAVKVLKWLGVKIILTKWKHIVRNSTSVIYGIVLESRKEGSLSDQDAALIRVHLRKIEKSIGLVKVLDFGNSVHLMNEGEN